MKKLFVFALLVAGAVFFVRFITPEDTWIKVGQSWVKHGNPSSGSPEDKIQKFKSADELRTFLEENQNQAGGYGGGRGGAMLDTGGVQNLSSSSLKVTAPEDFSKTNVQVEGVDEGDIVKTDGKYIYSVSNNNLFIIEATPAENAKVLAKIEFKSTPQGVYINGNSLVVYGMNNLVYDKPWYKSLKRQSPFTFFKVFDVTDPKNPRQVKDLDFEGSIIASRMIGDYVYLITDYYNSMVFDPIPYPRIMQGNVMINKAYPDVYYFNLPYNGFNFVSISALNVKNTASDVKSSVYLLPATQNVYVSQNNIYLTYTKYMSDEEVMAGVLKEILLPELTSFEKSRIADIESTPNYILNKEEKLQKISQILQLHLYGLSEVEQGKLQKKIESAVQQRYRDLAKQLEQTVIHKIAINRDRLEYKTYGAVTGTVLNQFSMDEAQTGEFRIATTFNQRSRFGIEQGSNFVGTDNNLYILDSNLNLMGNLEELAKGERIYSVRFMQGRAYLVTFKQTDPLFVIDVRNPRAPKVLGKLKVPGFSQYLHPYDETTLIGFGKETDDQGVVTGLKLSLFDVSNVDNLKEIDKVTLGDRGSNSVALYDHKAFLFSKDKNLLVIPVEIQESGFATGEPTVRCLGVDCIIPPSRNQYFRGAVVYEVTKNGFKLKGKIDHADNAEVSSGDWWGYGSYNTTVKRSLYIGDVLYTLSDKYVKANKISDLTLLQNLELKKEKNEDFKIVN